MHLKPLEQQTIVITGGTSGIGLATAKMAARRGANVVILARNAEGLEKVAADIRRDGGRCDHVEADMGSRAAVRAAIDTIVARHGGFDTWVNNAGIGAYSRVEELSDEDHEQMIQTNYWGVVYGSTEALRHLRARGGALINVGSISSEVQAPLLSLYTASKFAVKGFTDSLRLELMHDRAPVSLTLIQPSGIHTPFGRHAKNLMDARSKVPPPVYAPELVADAILHAAAHPRRDIVIGGAGRAMTWLSNNAPSLADALFSRAFFKTARDEDRPKRSQNGGFDTHGRAGDLYGDQEDAMRTFSVWTSLQLRPEKVLPAGALAGAAGLAAARTLGAPLVAGLGLAAGAAAIGLAAASWALRPEPQGDQDPRRDTAPA